MRRKAANEHGPPSSIRCEPTQRNSPEIEIANYLHQFGIRHIIAVPCRYLETLLRILSNDRRFSLLYATREEEGIAIAAGIHLGGGNAALLMQNSGLGNLINAYQSLCRHYEIPMCMFISQRGDSFEQVDAQRPMGNITHALLELMGIPYTELGAVKDLSKVPEGLTQFTRDHKSTAFIARKSLWITQQ
jgi:sulfopyruvate decarboxylase alpha subunit